MSLLKKVLGDGVEDYLKRIGPNLKPAD
jgi:hypothetical protein